MRLTGDQVTILVTVAALVIDWIVRIIAIIVVPRNRKPTAGMAWLLAIFFIPYIGIVLYLLIGNPKLPRAIRAKQAEVNRVLRQATQGVERVTDRSTWPAWFSGLVYMNWRLGALPMVGGNSARLHYDYEATLAAMTSAISGAQRTVHLQSYILELDSTTSPLFEAIRAAVARGVTVRVLLDHVATARSWRGRATVRALNSTGASWSFMMPFQPFKGKVQRPDLRNHRKILVVDGEVAFSGSLNIIDRSYNKRANRRRGLQWVELVGEFRGPIVSGLDAVFATDWYLETGEVLDRSVVEFAQPSQSENLDCQVVPSGPGFPNENNLKLFLALLYGATEQIIITSPYFVPNEALMSAISSATQRGVRVELFVSEISDQALVYHAQRSYYEALLKAGVRIWMYRAPFILHSKHVTVDGDIAVIGSSNMDIRSFELNKESSVLVRGERFVQDLREVEQRYRDASVELDLDTWRAQPLRSTVLDNLARLTSALQ
ncbi:MAG TPA: cardiolipin synthase [Microbacteriaceae bacterium]|nr:cardiolipin synthase [Microbacteriaceae bacterium]